MSADSAAALEAKLRAAIAAVGAWEAELAEAVEYYGATAVADLFCKPDRPVAHTTVATWAGRGRGQPMSDKLVELVTTLATKAHNLREGEARHE